VASQFVPRRWMAFLTVAGAVTIFVAPFAHAPSQQVASVSYVAGCDNRIASVGLALLSLTVMALVWRRLSPPEIIDERRRLPRALVLGAFAFTVVFTLALGWAIQRADVRFAESNYFLNRIRNILEFQMRIYRDLEFPYGPMLLYPAVWMARLFGPRGISVASAYFATLALMNVLGVAMVAYLVDRLPMLYRWRLLLFVACVLLQTNPLAGPNYSLYKFALPFAGMVWASRRSGWWAKFGGFVLAELAVLLVSPELGIGMTAGVVTYAVVYVFRGQNQAVVLLFAPVVSVALFLAGFGHVFLDRLGHASSGALNLIPEPSPHLLIFGFAIVFLVPVMIGWMLRARSENAALIAGAYLLSIGMLPGALGRCDPLHVFFYGFGFFVLAFVAIGAYSRRAQVIWASAFVLFAVQVQGTNFKVVGPALRGLLHDRRTDDSIDVNALRAATGGARVSTPEIYSVPVRVEEQMRADGMFVPDYYPGLAEVWDAEGEERVIASMRKQGWALVPDHDGTFSETLPNTPFKLAMRFGYHYKARHAPFELGALLHEELAARWTPVRTFGNLTLYRQTMPR
jgi:hypothetical protein